MKLFTKTWKQDLYWLKWAFRSVYKYADEPVEWHVVTENNTCDEVRLLADECTKLSNAKFDHRIIVHSLDLWPEIISIKDDYMGQQWIKMTSFRVIGDDMAWNWDSDVFARNHFTEADFIGKDNKPVYWFSQLERFQGSRDYAVLRQRADLLEIIFENNTKVSNEWMRCMPIPLIGSILRAGANTHIWRNSYTECAKGNRAFSEFNAIGQFAHMYFNNAFDWHEPEVSGPTWAGSVQAGDEMEKKPVVDIVFQSWSWGGITAEIDAWIKKEFGSQ